MNEESSLLCPSARCEQGALLLGVVHPAGVGIAAQPIKIDESFVLLARNGRRPESRFRFASPCIEKGCKNWNGRCAIADRISADMPSVPACGIRSQCRWFSQNGASACAGCLQVITDTGYPLASLENWEAKNEN